jgi:exosortase/archaeosortase family protein
MRDCVKEDQDKVEAMSMASVDDPRAWALRILAFFALFFAMQSWYASERGLWVEQLVIDQLTVEPAAWLINLLDPDVGVLAIGSKLRAPGGGINVLNGCEGTDVLFLLVAGLLISPLPWRARLAGALVGTALVFSLNQVRVVALFYAFRADRELFGVLHGLVTPVMLIAAMAVFYMLWLRRYAEVGPKHG